MKEEKYSISDKEYLFTLGVVSRVLEDAKFYPIIVGGGATQCHIADKLSRYHGNIPIEKLVERDLLVEGENFRRTDDIDLAIKEGIKGQDGLLDVVRSLDGLETETEDDIYIVSLERIGLKRPILNVKSLNKSEGLRIMLNISNKQSDLFYISEQYENFIENGQKLYLTCDDVESEVRVARPEHVVAAKLTHNRPKDMFDVHALLDTFSETGEPFDMDEVKRILEKEYKNIYDLFLMAREERKI